MSFVWKGLKEFRADLTKVPTELTDQATRLVAGAAAAAFQEIRAALPARTGTLRQAVRVVIPEEGPGVARREIRSEARYAWFIEYGYVAHGPKRRHIAGRPIVVPITMKHRKQLGLDLRALLKPAGFDARG